MSQPKQTALDTPYTHWIHCNTCYQVYIKKERRFYLLACLHITCESCIVSRLEQALTREQIFNCSACEKITKACEINNTMPKNLKELFHPEPYTDGLNSYQIMTFQVKHRNRFLAYHDMIIAKKEECRREIVRLKEQAQKIYKEYEENYAERKHLEKRVRLIRKQRREIDDNRSVKSPSSSSSEHSSSSGPRGSPTTSDKGITSFSNLTHTHSFVL